MIRGRLTLIGSAVCLALGVAVLWRSTRGDASAPNTAIATDAAARGSDVRADARESQLADPGVKSLPPPSVSAPVVVKPNQEERRSRSLQQEDRMQRLAHANNWQQAVEGMSREQLFQKSREIEDEILLGSQSEFERRFTAGDFEIVNEGNTYTASDANRLDVYQVRIPPGGPVQRSTLPDDAEHATLLEKRAHSVWLCDLAANTPTNGVVQTKR